MKKTALSVLLLVAVFGIVTFAKVSAGITENLSGWFWGGGTEIDGIAPWDGTNTNFGWISANNTSGGGAISYGVNIPPTNGTVTGYAWSEWLGWIDFEPQAHCTPVTTPPPLPAGHYWADSCTPPSGNAEVLRNGNLLQGWARIVSIAQASKDLNSGGNTILGVPYKWVGWIKLNGSSYGVSISGSNLSGYGWSDELGWIDFDQAIIAIPKTVTGSITATPSTVPDNSTPVSVTAMVTGGDATGNVIYALDCTNDGTPEITTASTPLTTYTFSDACTYSASATVAVTITREGASTEPTASITYGCWSSTCSGTSCTFYPEAGPCTSGCINDDSCKAPPVPYKEVLP